MNKVIHSGTLTDHLPFELARLGFHDVLILDSCTERRQALIMKNRLELADQLFDVGEDARKGVYTDRPGGGES